MTALPVDGTDQLHAALDNAEGTVFVALDAAVVPGLQDALSLSGLDWAPLYLDEVDNPSIAAGPHLIAAPDRASRERALALASPAGGTVWWFWDAGMDALSTHLRSLGMVELPKDRYEIPVAARAKGFEPVLFRHADAPALSDTLAALGDGQRARLLGGAKALILHWPDPEGGWRIERHDPVHAVADPGLLRIYDDAQYRRIAARRTEGIAASTASWLRRHVPEMLPHATDAGLLPWVRAEIDRARDHAIVTEPGYRRWCYLQALTRGGFAEQEGVDGFFADPRDGRTPDQKVEDMVASVAAAARGQRGAQA